MFPSTQSKSETSVQSWDSSDPPICNERRAAEAFGILEQKDIEEDCNTRQPSTAKSYVISSSVFNPDTNKVERAFFTSLAPTHSSVTDNERTRRISIANELSCKITEGLKQSSEQWLPSCVKDGSTFELQRKEREIYNLLSKDDPYKETGLTFYPYVDMAESIPWDPLEVC
ncbi:hypothetical protein C343_03341 [Cryptococcus neoformans C23]|uniref:Uncharacterized protein n=1 Tax=Cryptococcus neoformans (strain H99 / ATCC 208821 / CBS 10515 / FGSC 9487) TaxID=235443 RepID=J9VU33_CRYN9|nr:hypothetical protein CNAG_00885 [Cryptococcus neoformans var. grubii H99]AFR95245.1 hypothetical protein CNAG_00885 [Cryptococcus neoformans var. grubii H99]AUB25018.1 hypothetical protein CKF44_00885 [Cryptococcus neoformans var. grubii]OWZ31839.1 hypothetical protein C347_03404 [Cryptococcus neoformans var. grubii AD2-60a]OWZ43914.1 hypothetical protein C343_03341 [Cryptococcus neoformans var. grubii C23]|eukprot:XP_012049169.1 hypothetical protein CNAG_00885 [Cryptococcus neoformans var. grubii H99]